MASTDPSDTTTQASVPTAAPPAEAIDVEAIRFSGERSAADGVRSDRWLTDLVVVAEARGRSDASRTRRQLQARSELLTRGMAPDVWEAASLAAQRLGIDRNIEIHRTTGSGDPAVHLVEDGLLLEVRGRLLTLLDGPSTVAMMGHELGHHLAHGRGSRDGALGIVVNLALEHPGVPPESVQAASILAMARTITADRFSLLACRDLSAALRLEMATTTGLASDALTWETSAYLAQCTALVAADGADAAEHAQHGLRAWAMGLFAETDVFLALTGSGTGAKTVTQVDAEISKVLGSSSTEQLVYSAFVLDPIPEVHECALASASLVALADGELSEEESVAIERVFSPLVADWQRYLVWDNALEGFADTASVVAAGGPTVQRSVFQVLVHVLAADADVETREVETVCAIGDALQAGSLFRAMLAPVLKAFGEPDRDLSKIREIIPMPARAQEAETALEVFLQGIHRRGGGEATLRRMYRLLGDRDGSRNSQATVRRVMTTVGLQTQVHLDDTPLDLPIPFSLTEAAAEQAYEHARTVRMRVPTDLVQTARQRLSRGLSRLRESLVSGDGRSPSVRLRQCRTGRTFDLFALESMSVGHGERVLTLASAAEPARVVDGREVGVHTVAERVSRELLALQRESLARSEQTGARDLYIGYPFLTGVIGGYLVRAPLVLYPYELERTEARGFQLLPRTGEPRIVNQALLRVLFSKKGMPFPEDLAEALDRAADDDVDAVRQVLADTGLRARPESDSLKVFEPRDEDLEAWPDGRVVIEPCAVLGFFPQSTSDMIQDYDDLLTAVADPRVPLAEKLGAAGPLLPVELREELAVSEEVDDDDAPGEAETSIVPVVSADPSQLAVLQRARTQRALVVDGPPGTGKSQVIVNLVADALARGQTVAVVCEKRAALDVVAQRLEQVGLRHLIGVVHDVHDDRRGLYNQIVARLGEGNSRDIDVVKADRVDEDLAAVMGELGVRRSALLQALGEDRPSLGQLHLLAASFGDVVGVPMDPSLVQLAPRELQRLADRVGREAHHAEIHAVTSVWRAPEEGPARPSLADAGEELLFEIENTLRGARSTAAAVHALVEAQGVRTQDVARAADAIRAAVRTNAGRKDRSRRELIAAWLVRGDDPGLEGLVRRVQSAFDAVEIWQGAMPDAGTFDLGIEAQGALVVTRSWGGSIFRWFSLSFWRARSVIRTTLAAQWPAALGSTVDDRLAARLEQRAEGAAAWAALNKLLAVLQIQPVIPDTASAVVWVERIVETYEASRPVVEAEDLLRQAEAWPETPRGAALDRWAESLEERLALLEAAKAHAAAFAPVRAQFPWWPACPPVDRVVALHEAWALDAARVRTSDHNVDAATELYPRARGVVEQFADSIGEADASRWSDAVEHGWATAAIEQIERRFPNTRALDRASAADVQQAEKKLARLVVQRAEYHVKRIVQARDQVPLLTEARPEKGRTETPLHKAREQMLREANKRRYILSLRSYVRQFADQGLMDLLPVWLVSPETVAVLFPGRPVFDLVVMDEASQCTVEKGLPALMRGHRAVIAGDDKQMPPTSFFEARGTEEEDPGTEDMIEADALTAESLLVLARERCVHEGLRWHYRCLREELIAFSNHAMYGGDLFTIPSTSTARARPALVWEAVEDATYDQGVNLKEAAKVVDVLTSYLQGERPPSMGVVTFNIQQRQAILDAIDARCESDPAFAEAYAAAASHEELDQRPFVKNLEAVQGDERDVIVFSLGHAPVRRRNGERHVPARFGPLGQVGGERRLNVAVSRAKRATVVVASFSPSMLSVGNTKHAGPKLLKAFLTYAWDLTQGRRLQAEKTLEAVRHGGLAAAPVQRHRGDLEVVPLAAQLASHLEAEGLSFDVEVGTSGFRVPLAIIDPADPNHYKVAVLMDIGVGNADVVDRHLHQPSVLAARGWRVVRVDSRSWDRDRQTVIRRIVAAARR